MDIRKLELFVDLAQTLDYTTTADHLFTTQGNVSKAIMSLEKELDTKLFDRSHRKISLTEAGQIALAPAQKILQESQNLQALLARHKKQQTQRLTMLFIPTAPDYQGFAKISDFIKANPDITVTLKEVETRDILPLLAKSSDTIAFTRTWVNQNQALPADMEICQTETDEFAVILPAHHPLAQAQNTTGTVDLAQLKDENFLLQDENSAIYPEIMKLCQAAGFAPKVTYKGVRNDILLSMVERDLGISILMRKSIQRQLTDKVVLRPLTPTQISSLVFISPNLEKSAAVKAFFEGLGK